MQVTIETCNQGTQRPVIPSVPYKDQCKRRQREFRADVIETMKDTALKYVCFEEKDLPVFMKDIIQSKKWSSASGLSNNLDVCANPTVQALIREYKEAVDKEKKTEARRRIHNLKGKICIGSSIKNSRINFTGENTPEDFKNCIHAANTKNFFCPCCVVNS